MNGQNLKDLLKESGKTQTQIALDLGLGLRSVQRYCARDGDIPVIVELAVKRLVSK